MCLQVELNMFESSSSKLHKHLLNGDRIDLSDIQVDADRRMDASWLKEAALSGVEIDVTNAIFSGVVNLKNTCFMEYVHIIDSKFLIKHVS